MKQRKDAEVEAEKNILEQIPMEKKPSVKTKLSQPKIGKLMEAPFLPQPSRPPTKRAHDADKKDKKENHKKVHIVFEKQ